MKHKRIIFMGTPELAALVLRRLIVSGEWAPKLVITQPDKPVGKHHLLTPPPVKTLAMEHNIAVWQPEKLKDHKIISDIKEWKPDCIIIAAYGTLIQKEILDIPPHGILNVHPSLLPRGRGPSPVASAILEGDHETGATIMLINEGMDSGPVLAQKSLPVEHGDTTLVLSEKLFTIGADLLLATLPKWFAGAITLKSQDEKKATFSRLLKKEDGMVTLEDDVERVERMVRALNPWPGAYMVCAPKKTLKLLRVRTSPCETIGTPLSFSVTTKKELCLHTKNGCVILESVHPEGKKPMSGYAFYIGNIKN